MDIEEDDSDDERESCAVNVLRLGRGGEKSLDGRWKPGVGGNFMPPGIPPWAGENNDGDDWWCRRAAIPPAGGPCTAVFSGKVPGNLIVSPRLLGLRRGFCGGGAGLMKAGDVGADIERGLWLVIFSVVSATACTGEVATLSGFSDKFLVFRGFLLGDRERV